MNRDGWKKKREEEWELAVSRTTREKRKEKKEKRFSVFTDQKGRPVGSLRHSRLTSKTARRHFSIGARLDRGKSFARWGEPRRSTY